MDRGVRVRVRVVVGVGVGVWRGCVWVWVWVWVWVCGGRGWWLICPLGKGTLQVYYADTCSIMARSPLFHRPFKFERVQLKSALK